MQLLRFGTFTFLLFFSSLLAAQGKEFPIVENWYSSFKSYNNDARIIDAGSDEFIVAWRSARNGNGYSNIYLQKIDKQGNFLWEHDGTPVCAFPANQSSFDIVNDAFGGVIIVWEDSREGPDNEKLFAQRINSLGEILWENEGIRICSGSGRQINPKIQWDNKNGFFVVWEDTRAGTNEKDIYAQHLNLAGRLNWMFEGLPLVTAPNVQQHITLSTDAETGVIVLWEDFRNGRYWNLYAQKLDRRGDYAWNENGLDIFAGREENHHNASMVADGYGGFLFVYQKYSEKTRGYDIFRGRINNDGSIAYHYSTCFAPEDQLNPVITKMGRDAVICWEDMRNGNRDIFAQQVRIRDGIFNWDQNGSPVVERPGEDRLPKIVASVASNYQMFVWQHWENDEKVLYAQKLDNFGVQQLDPAGMLVCKGSNEQEQHAVVYDNDGGMLCAWTDYRESNSNFIFVQRLNTNGLPLLEQEGIKLAAQQEGLNTHLEGLDMISAMRGNYYLAWVDYRNGKGNGDIYVQKMDPKGKPQWRPGGVPICTYEGNQGRPELIEDGVGGVICAWIDGRKGRDEDIFVQRISPSGRILWEQNGVPVCEAPRGQSQIEMVSDGKEGVVICWSDARNLIETGFDLYINRINFQGDIMWGRDGKAFARFEGLQTAPSLASDGEGGAFVAWQDNRTGWSNIFIQHINSFGIFEWEYGGRRTHPGEFHQRSPQLVRNFLGDLILVWEDAGGGDGNEKIRINSITTRGFRQWGSRGKVVANISGKQVKPSLLTDDSGNIWVTWLDERSRSTAGVRMYTQKYSSSGTKYWDDLGVSIGSNLDEYNEYAVILNPKGYAYYFWNAKEEDSRAKKVFFQKLRPDGAKKAGYYGATVGDKYSSQLYPVMAINADSKVLVCWVKNDPIKKTWNLVGSFIREL